MGQTEEAKEILPSHFFFTIVKYPLLLCLGRTVVFTESAVWNLTHIDCVRLRSLVTAKGNVLDSQPAWTAEARRPETQQVQESETNGEDAVEVPLTEMKTNFMVLGIFDHGGSQPREYLSVIKESNVRAAIWKGIAKTRGFRRFLSLKKVKRFGLYQCHPREGYHERLKLGEQNDQILLSFWQEYRTNSKDLGDWNVWIFETLHKRKGPSDESGLSLELVLGWSATRIVVVTAVPLILSLVVSVWYMQHTGDVQTAWTIGSYIVTTAGIFIAVLAAVTQFGGV